MREGQAELSMANLEACCRRIIKGCADEKTVGGRMGWGGVGQGLGRETRSDRRGCGLSMRAASSPVKPALTAGSDQIFCFLVQPGY